MQTCFKIKMILVKLSHPIFMLKSVGSSPLHHTPLFSQSLRSLEEPHVSETYLPASELAIYPAGKDVSSLVGLQLTSSLEKSNPYSCAARRLMVCAYLCLQRTMRKPSHQEHKASISQSIGSILCGAAPFVARTVRTLLWALLVLCAVGMDGTIHKRTYDRTNVGSKKGRMCVVVCPSKRTLLACMCIGASERKEQPRADRRPNPCLPVAVVVVVVRTHGENRTGEDCQIA